MEITHGVAASAASARHCYPVGIGSRSPRTIDRGSDCHASRSARGGLDELLGDRANEQYARVMVSAWPLQPAIQTTRATDKAERRSTAAFSNCMGTPTDLSPPVRPSPPPLLPSRDGGGDAPGGTKLFQHYYSCLSLIQIT
ncbi:MAG: hypothetical protein MUO67_15905 [Anaerolineales bacterium]|nr:hypothetical protein [Anaerolineales bacterium]